MAVRPFIARQLYESNCSAHGWKDREGNPLPTWPELLDDPKKHPVVDMWVAAADRVVIRPSVAKVVQPGGWD